MLTKPKIRLRKEWGALTPDSGMYAYPGDIRQYYYRLTFHHGTDSARNPREVLSILRSEQLVHMEHGWRDIGYHYLIDPWGRIWQGRNIHFRGVHVADANTGNLGICFVMHGDREPLSQPAEESAINLAAWWCSYLRINPREIRGHRDYLATACPGSLVYPRLVVIRNKVLELVRGDD